MSGLSFITPFLYEAEGYGFVELLWMYCAEIPSVFILYYMIDN